MWCTWPDKTPIVFRVKKLKAKLGEFAFVAAGGIVPFLKDTFGFLLQYL